MKIKSNFFIILQFSSDSNYTLREDYLYLQLYLSYKTNTLSKNTVNDKLALVNGTVLRWIAIFLFLLFAIYTVESNLWFNKVLDYFAYVFSVLIWIIYFFQYFFCLLAKQRCNFSLCSQQFFPTCLYCLIDKVRNLGRSED